MVAFEKTQKISASMKTIKINNQNSNYIQFGEYRQMSTYRLYYFFQLCCLHLMSERRIWKQTYYCQVQWSLIEKGRKILRMILINENWWYSTLLPIFVFQGPDRWSCVPVWYYLVLLTLKLSILLACVKMYFLPKDWAWSLLKLAFRPWWCWN